MVFFGLFKSRAERDREAKIKFRQGKARIQRFLQQAQQAGDNYWRLAKQAYQLGDQEQFKQLGANYLRIRESINRWERYIVKLDSLEMLRNEVEATGEFLKSMNALTGTILRGASPAEIARMQVDVEKALEKSEAQEEMLNLAMEAAGTTLTSTSDLNDNVLNQLIAGFGGTPSATYEPLGRSQPAIEEDNPAFAAEIRRALQNVDNDLHARR